jgi:HD-GYP domain-containing protein (c-di-GMP phosphodiesterase class II)
MHKFNLITRIYILLLVALVIALCAFSFRLEQKQPLDISNVAYLLILATIADGYIFKTNKNYGVTPLPTVHIAAIFLLPPYAAIMVSLISITIDQSIKHRPGFIKGLFNISQRVIITAVPAFIVYFSGIDIKRIDDPNFLVTASTVILVYYLLDVGLVDLVITLSRSASFWQIWKLNTSSTLLLDLTLPALGIILAVIWIQSPIFCLLLAFPIIVNQNAYRSLRLLEIETTQAIIAITELVEARDPYTFGHSMRVGGYCRAISKELGLSDELVEQIALSGTVHDLGKIGISDNVLRKPGALTAEEWVEMKKHPETGAKILAKYSFYEDGVNDVLYHHESWDGTGYPQGLTEETIPLGARIIAVADSFDAMTTDRPYRKGMPIIKALTILNDRRNIQWDARVVDAFLRVMHKIPQTYPELSDLLPDQTGKNIPVSNSEPALAFRSK